MKESELREEYLNSDYPSGSAGYRKFFVDRITALEADKDILGVAFDRGRDEIARLTKDRDYYQKQITVLMDEVERLEGEYENN